MPTRNTRLLGFLVISWLFAGLLATNLWAATGVVYGVRAGEEAYRMLPIYYDVGDKPALYTLNITPTWQTQNGDRKPTVWIDRIELDGRSQRAPFISGLLRTRTMYAPGTPASKRVMLEQVARR